MYLSHIKYCFSFQKEAKILLSYKKKFQDKESKNMIVVLIICQWEEDKMKYLIPGVSDIYFWFSRGTRSYSEAFRVLHFCSSIA